MEYHPLPEEYINALGTKEEYCLTIMGKDPYPRGATGIPFCKPDWDTFCAYGVSGLSVFRSLGVDIRSVRSKFNQPSDYFIYLVQEKGVVFLNLSYHFLAGRCGKKKHSEQLRNAEEINRQYLHKSKNIILCGEANKIRWYEDTYNDIHSVVHPDIRNKYSSYESVKNCWLDYWRDTALKEKYNILIE